MTQRDWMTRRLAKEARAMTADALIARYIEPNPDPSRLYDSHTTEGAAPIYAIIGLLQLTDWNVDKVAKAYLLPCEAVRAAIAFYRRHPRNIDLFLAVNAE